jgi:hypothetical protein
VTKSWISVFNVDGQILMPDVFIDNFKYDEEAFGSVRSVRIVVVVVIRFEGLEIIG